MDTKKLCVIALLAFVIAIISLSLAQNAQNTADANANITNVFEIVVNNTNLAPTFPGEVPGTGERVSGNLYWTNTSPIEIFIWAHAMVAGETAEVHLIINNTKVQDTAGVPIASAQQNNKSIAAIIPKGSNYSVVFNNFHHYEWREYPILSGKNGTLSINQTVIQTTTVDLSSVNNSLNSINNSKVNKSGDTSTGLQTFNAGINSTSGSINANGNLLSPLTPSFSGWFTNPGTNSDLVRELNTVLSTPAFVNATQIGAVKYDLGTSTRVIVSIFALNNTVNISNTAIFASDDDLTYFAVSVCPRPQTGLITNTAACSGVAKARFLSYRVYAQNNTRIDQMYVRAYNI